VRLGSEHADHRYCELPLEVGQGGGRRRVAGRDDELDPLALEVAGDLSREAADLVERPRAVGQPGAVAQVDEVLVRKGDEALVEDGQPAHAGVEDADRALVHPRDCRAAVRMRRLDYPSRSW
jgi:acyl-CoA synthetase (NDP forming)